MFLTEKDKLFIQCDILLNFLSHKELMGEFAEYLQEMKQQGYDPYDVLEKYDRYGVDIYEDLFKTFFED